MPLSPSFAFLRKVPVSRQTSPPMACLRLSRPRPISSSLLGQNNILFVSFCTSETVSKIMKGTEIKSVPWKHPKWHQCHEGKNRVVYFWLQALFFSRNVWGHFPNQFQWLSIVWFSARVKPPCHGELSTLLKEKREEKTVAMRWHGDTFTTLENSESPHRKVFSYENGCQVLFYK